MPRPLREGVRFEGVRFAYPGSERTALERLDLELRAGEVTALVGGNGSGKTTLVKLLCRLYDPAEGRVTFDGVDVREMDPAELRRGMSVIFQDFTRNQLTALFTHERITTTVRAPQENMAILNSVMIRSILFFTAEGETIAGLTSGSAMPV